MTKQEAIDAIYKCYPGGRWALTHRMWDDQYGNALYDAANAIRELKEEQIDKTTEKGVINGRI